MNGVVRGSSRRKRLLAIVLFSMIFLSGCLGSSQENAQQTDPGSEIVLEVWHTFAAESKEEEVFMNSVSSFESAYPNVTVEVTMVPFGNADQLFMTAAQGGQAPDLMRLSSDQLGSIGEVRVDGFPLLEDLRPHLTPQDRAVFEERALQAMRYGDALYGIPASQDCLSLIYNKALFDAQGLAYPDETWTERDLLDAAKLLTYQDVQGLAIPIKTAYWWFPIQGGFGGSLFDENGKPSLDSNGSSEAMRWMLDLELEHGVVATGTQIEGMKNQFISSKAAMIFDGPWNWATYEASRLNIGQTLLPMVESTGERMSPLVTYKGWTVSKQSANKVAATELALWLSSEDVQKEFAVETYTMPTHVALESDSNINDDAVLAGFLEQTKEGTPAPTTRAMSLVYDPLSTAFEQAYSGISSTSEALSGANQQLEEQIESISRADSFPLADGYRTITIEFETTNSTSYDVFVDGALHTEIRVGLVSNGSLLDYDSCTDGVNELPQIGQQRIAMASTQTIQCALTGMVPDLDHIIEVFGDDVLIFSTTQRTSVADERPEAGDTSPVVFALGAIVLSLIALLSFAKWNDTKLGRTKSKLAHFYVAPALLALAILTFYPVLYGFWLAFTDANQTQLGDQSFIGLDNFFEVFSAEGFLRVTLFTLVWTVVNVSAHIGIGLFLANMLHRSRIYGKVAYRTLLLLPWAVPSYISVLVWRGMFQPDGFVNDLLGTNIDFLSDPTGAQIIVILVNIWLGVPFMMMSISGALQSIPKDMYEAAELDGVVGWAAFRYLTLPNLRSALIPLTLLGFIWTFNMFNVIYLMTDGGPNLYFGQPGQTDILITYVYDVAFREGAYGVAAAWSVIIFLMLFAFSWRYMKQTNATEAVA
ncbi:MAG: Maltose transport system permease protein MalF [Candidatus Poseidoniaceae archaeon]|nr:MAG: Maltose transport system permease protein MalF [Candidatus Poseidoniaceae archaeon]